MASVSVSVTSGIVCSSLVVLLLIQPLCAKPALKDPSEHKDEYARKAADALDSTLLSFKEGLNSLIQDSKVLSNMMSKLASDIINLAPQGKVVNTEESKQRLQEMRDKANKTLSDDGLFKMDDDVAD